MKLSIIVPCKNRNDNIIELHNKIKNALDKIKYEIIYIDDGSTDRTLNQLKKIYEEDMQHVKVLSFSRQFNKDAAILAGIKYSSGKYVCIMDSELVSNPQEILTLYNYLEEHEECDIVSIKKNIRKTKIIEWINKYICKHYNVDMADIYSIDKMFRNNVKEALINNGNKFSQSIYSWIGYNLKYINEDNISEERIENNYYNYVFDVIKLYSVKPFSFSIYLGIFNILIAIIIFIISLIFTMGLDNTFNTGCIIIILLLILFGIQFILTGVVGNYIVALNKNMNNSSYVIKEKIGFSNETIL
ncbi:MAG: glycosyltransferase [Candidatus Coprovivens sp.]